MTPIQELADIARKMERTIAEMIANLLAELIARTPVDTGTLKTSWEITKVGDGWILSNNMNYASFIFNGIRIVQGKQLGSKQLPDGVAPIIQQFNRELQKRLDLI